MTIFLLDTTLRNHFRLPIGIDSFTNIRKIAVIRQVIMKFCEISQDCGRNPSKILFSGYCGLFVSLLFLQHQTFPMPKERYHIPIGQISPSYQAHCSGQELCAFFVNKTKPCSLLLLKTAYADIER